MKRVKSVDVVFWGYVAIWTTLLLVPDPGAFLPGGATEQLARSPVPLDKAVHASGYLLLMLLAAAAFNTPSSRVAIVWLFAGGAAHGAITELAQCAVPPREGEWRDFVADVVGLGIGALVWRLFRRSAPSRDGTE